MKKRLLLLFAFIMTVFVMNAQTDCNVFITSSFSSRCVLTEFSKDNPLEENKNKMLACKESTVEYYAESDNATSYTWTVTGAYSQSVINGGKGIRVFWGNGNIGKVTVQVITPDGVCEATKDITLLEKPEIGSSSIPSYKWENGVKIIEICLGETVTFTNESTTSNTDLVGHYWESKYGGPASTENYTIENVMQETKVIHKIINNCGCEDEEMYEIRIMGGTKLELSCYGTVCENSTVTYKALNATCTDYNWSVEGGQIVSGQHSPEITIEWGSPQCGYGVLGLDGGLCGNFCPKFMSVKIPIITNHAEITGQTNLCQDEDIVLYSLPLWGSTEYTWTVTPNTGYTKSNYENSNQTLLSFYNAGTYQLTATYKCDFLECGPFTSQTKTITVRPVLKITSPKDRVCLGDVATFTLNNNNITATWRVYNSGGQQVYTTQNNILNYTSTLAGKYRITAENANYCNVAEFLIEVKNRPPAPTISNIPGSSVACPNSSISLSGTAASNLYNLIWKPQCTDATPSEVSGENVNINLGATVCNINVYHYDKEVGCLSNPYIYPISPFALLSTSLPSTITTCSGSTIEFMNDEVPNQSSDVLYEWTITPQNAATIEGSKISNNVRILVNDLSTPNSTFTLKLKRNYCTNKINYSSITVHVIGTPSPLIISAPDEACMNTPVSITYDPSQTLPVPAQNSHFHWHLDDGAVLEGITTSHSFGLPGTHNIELVYKPFQYCQEVTSNKTITILAAPPIDRLQFDGTNISVYPSLPTGTKYYWTFNGAPITNYNVGGSVCPTTGCSFVPHTLDGTYSCTVTSANGCSAFRSINLPLDPVINPCTSTIPLNIRIVSQNLCNQTIQVEVLNNTTSNNVNWNITPQNATITITGQNTANIKFNDVGIYSITAFFNNGSNCYQGNTYFTLPFILENLEANYNCVNQKIDIKDNSKYLNSPGVRQCSITGVGLGNISWNIPAGNLNTSVGPLAIPGCCTVVWPITLNYNGCTISNSFTIYPSASFLDITTSNTLSPSTSCENVPIQLIAKGKRGNPMTGIYEVPINEVYWNFGDGSTNTINGNSTYHTFAQSTGNPVIPYTVTAIAKDANGCSVSNTTTITSYNNTLSGAKLYPTLPNDVCPGLARSITYNVAGAHSYQWYSPLNVTNTLNNINTYFTSDYTVLVRNTNGCIDEKMTNVGFLNKPKAFIAGNTEFCQGETVKLNGDLGQTGITYDWQVTDQNNNTQTFSTSNITFPATISGTYTIALTVNNGDCTSDPYVHTITVHATPPAPGIGFAGNKCIDQPPVVLGATSPNGEPIYWNSGIHNPTADYYSPGNALAYYYDPTSGCKSQDAKIFIEPAPNFDALLTGCYKKCPKFFPSSLNAYSLSSHHISWKWLLNSSGIANGSGTYLYSPLSLLLPNPGFGTYNLDVQYNGGNCNVKSPSLVIEQEDCPCANVNVKVTPTKQIQDCKIIYYVKVTICNSGSSKACLTTLELSPEIDGINILGTNNFPLIITSGNCQTFDFKFEVTDPLVSSATFQMYDKCNKCYQKFTVDINVEILHCGEAIEIQKLKFRPDLSNHNVSYFDFKLFLPSYPQAVFRVWVEPSQVIDHIYDPSSSTINGLAMFDYGVLTKMAANGEKVCFHVIMCKGNIFCESEICIGAKELLDIIKAGGGKSTSSKENTKDDQEGTLYLVPNPADTYVKVEGIEQDNISELLLIDMTGKNLKKVQGTNTLDIQDVLKGTYILRVINKENKVYYLKLIKN